MRNALRKTEADTNRTAGASTFRALLLTCILIAAVGCEQPSGTTASLQAPTSGGSLMQQADLIIRQALADPDPRLRANAIEVVEVTKQVRLMPKVQRLLADQSVPVRFLAILAVGDLQYALAKESIAQALNDQNENIRIAAAYAMTRFGHSEYVQVFRNAVASQDQTVRANAALLLGKTGDRSALRFLYWTLQRKDSADKVILQAAESIAMLGDERIYPKLWTRLISAYADDRVLGVRAMGALGTAEAKNALITMLDDAVLEVRLAAAEQLGKLNDRTGEPEVLDVFKKNLTAGQSSDDRERVNRLTALAIGEIGTDRLAKYLPQLLRDESKSVRLAAAKAVFRREMKN
ncbi:MAG: HEAT repeat domain-containing protein [Phycisphaerales bacterium]|nr:MAG: HEAT repeat domain-containing protein [Phycisphaerales bacterium]